MIETRLIEPDGRKDEGKLSFPLMAKRAADDMVILFSNEQSGMVIQHSTTGASYAKGVYRDDWYPVTNSNFWEILPRGYGVAIIQGKVGE